MKLFTLLALCLVLLQVTAQEEQVDALNPHEIDCSLVLCALPENCPCGFVTIGSNCCPSCCEECAQCLVDPCEGRICDGFPNYTCEPNYCGGCNRDWFDSEGVPVTCPADTIVREHCLKPQGLILRY
jgi:hypothetical protein